MQALSISSRIRTFSAIVAAMLVAAPASAQTNLQLWSAITVNWVKSDR